MYKPDWKNAPSWANWLTQDIEGTWYWFENKPYAFCDKWLADEGKYQRCDWDEATTIEERPK